MSLRTCWLGLAAVVVGASAFEAGEVMPGEPKVVRTMTMKVFPTQLEFSPDGKLLAVGDTRGGVTLWDVAGGKALRPLEGVKGEFPGVGALAFSPDGKTLAVRQQVASPLVFWDVENHKLKHRSEVGEGNIYRKGLAWSLDGRTLAASHEGTPVLIDTATGKVLRKLDFKENMAAVAFSPDGKRLATAHYKDQQVKVWDPETGKELYSFRGRRGDNVASLLFTPDGKTIITTSHEANNYLRYHDSGNGKSRFSFQIKNLSADAVAMSADGKVLAVQEFNEVVLRDGATGGQRAVIPSLYHTWFALARDGKRLATVTEAGDKEHHVRIWDIAAIPERAVFRQTQIVSTFAFSPNGKWIAAGSRAQAAWGVLEEERPKKPSGEVVVWDVAAARKEASILHVASVNAVVFSADNSLLISESDPAVSNTTPKGTPHQVRIRDMTQAKEIAVIEGHALQGVAADGKTVLFRQKNRLRLWERQTGKMLDLLETPAAKWSTLSPDGATIALPRKHGLEMWDVAKRATRATLKAPGGLSRAVFAPDGKRVAALDGGMVRLWNTSGDAQGLALPVPERPAGLCAVHSLPETEESLVLGDPEDDDPWLRFSPDGQALAVWNKTEALAYRAHDGKLLAKFADGDEEILAVDFVSRERAVAITFPKPFTRKARAIYLRDLRGGKQLAVVDRAVADVPPALRPGGGNLAFVDPTASAGVTLVGLRFPPMEK